MLSSPKKIIFRIFRNYVLGTSTSMPNTEFVALFKRILRYVRACVCMCVRVCVGAYVCVCVCGGGGGRGVGDG